MERKICLSLSILLFLSLFVGSVSALNIDATSPISVGTSFSFTVDFSSIETGNDGEVIVDGESAISVFKHSSGIYVDGDSVSSSVLSYKLNGDELVISYSGLQKGTKDIEIKEIEDGDAVDEELTSIKVVEPVTKEDKDVMQAEINSLNNKVSTLEENIAAKDAQITSLQNENNSLLNEIQSFESNIRTLEADGKTKDEILTEVKDDLNLLLTERESSRNTPIAGLFAFGAENSSLLLFALLIIALVVVGVFVKSRQTSIYDSPIFENEESNYEDKSIKEDEKEFKLSKPSPFKSFFAKRFSNKTIEVDKDTTKKGKWAAESYFPEKNSSKEDDNKRFDLGDLIKK